MEKANSISKADCITIAKKIRENIFKPAFTYKTSIFLCGADIRKNTTIRYKISEILTNRFSYAFNYDLIFPEDIFDELLYGSNSTDLLSLENLLADSVDAIVMIPESPGSFAELGAFANNEKLRSKLICVVDEKYKRDKSFINQGPLKLVRKVNANGVVYINPNEVGKRNLHGAFSILPFYSDPEVDKIVSALKKIKKNSTKMGNKVTLLQLDKFLLPTIFLLEPVNKNNLIEIVANAIEDNVNSTASTITAIAMLTKKRYIESTANGYILTKSGTNEFLSFRMKKSRYKEQSKTIAIDELRLEILNLKNRKKKLKV